MVQRKATIRRRPRAALCWGLGLFVLGQLAFLWALGNDWLAVRDPEYSRKLALLRARLAEKPGQPLVLLLGSSRVGCGVRPEVLDGPGGPLVFNFALCGSGPVMELLCLHRLLSDGVRPDYLLVEVWPPFFRGGGEAVVIDPHRLRWEDTRLLARYHPDAKAFRRTWLLAQLTPFTFYRDRLLNAYAPGVLPRERRNDANWAGLAFCGWLAYPGNQVGGEAPDWPKWFAAQLASHKVLLDDPRFDPAPDGALRELLGIARERHIRTALLLMPEAFQDYYPPASRQSLAAYLEQLRKDYGVGVIDARTWVKPRGFHEGVHLTYRSAAELTRRLGREVLPLLLKWQPNAPPGF